MTKTSKALELLISLINNNGAEFPDASNRVAFRFKLTPAEVSEVTEMYDDYCSHAYDENAECDAGFSGTNREFPGGW